MHNHVPSCVYKIPEAKGRSKASSPIISLPCCHVVVQQAKYEKKTIKLMGDTAQCPSPHNIRHCTHAHSYSGAVGRSIHTVMSRRSFYVTFHRQPDSDSLKRLVLKVSTSYGRSVARTEERTRAHVRSRHKSCRC